LSDNPTLVQAWLSDDEQALYSGPMVAILDELAMFRRDAAWRNLGFAGSPGAVDKAQIRAAITAWLAANPE